MNYCQLVSAQIRVFCLICFAAGLTFTESRAAVSVSMCSTVFALTAHFTIVPFDVTLVAMRGPCGAFLHPSGFVISRSMAWSATGPALALVRLTPFMFRGL